MPRGMTQKELAESLSLSQATVSFALSGRTDKVSEDVIKRVQEQVCKFGYRKPRRNILRKGESVAVLFPEMRPNDFMEGAILKMLRGFQTEAEREGWQLIQKICSDAESFRRALASAAGCVSLCNIPGESWASLKSEPTPLVMANGVSPLPQSDSVMPDDHCGIGEAVEALFNFGHRRIGFFAISELGGHHSERLGGYYQAMAELGLCPENCWSFLPPRAERSLPDTERLCRELLRKIKSLANPPTAIVCPADVYGLAIERVAAQEGFSIPGDLSVTGFDDTEECLVASPQLSSIGVDFVSLGEECAKILADRIRNPGRPSRILRVQAKLALRASVASPKA